jgi:hypothetical protein
VQEENVLSTSRVALLEQQLAAQEEAFLKLEEALEESLVSCTWQLMPPQRETY